MNSMEQMTTSSKVVYHVQTTHDRDQCCRSGAQGPTFSQGQSRGHFSCLLDVKAPMCNR